MNFAIGDILLDRFRLVEKLRDEPGFSAWLAQDNSLQRECQIFITSISSTVSQINTAASYLALSRNPHFTQVLHLHRAGEVCVIVSDIDPGMTLRNYAAAHNANPTDYPLDSHFIRSIIGEIATAAQELTHHDLAHYCINDLTARLTDKGIILADFPISYLLKPPASPLERSTNHDTESIMVYHIAALAFELLTKTPYTRSLGDQASAMLRVAHAPSDLALICARGLFLPTHNGRTTVPLVTLMELLVLLDEWTPLKELIKQSPSLADVSRETSPASITEAVINPVDPQYVVELPESLKSKAEPETDQKTPEWSTSALIFGGPSAVAVDNSDTNTDLFQALHQLDESSLGPSYDPYAFNDFDDQNTHTVGLNTSAIRVASSYDSQQAGDTQEHISTHEVGRAHRTHLAHSENANRTSPASEAAQVAPPSFIPQERMAAPLPQDSYQSQRDHEPEAITQEQPVQPAATSATSSSPKGNNHLAAARNAWQARVHTFSQTRAARVIIAIIIMVAVLALAVYSLTLGGSPEEHSSDPWSTISQEDVPFPGQTDSSSSQDTNQNKPKTEEKEKESSSQTQSKTQSQNKAKTNTQKKSEKKSASSSPSASTKSVQRTADKDIKAVKLPAQKSASAVPTPVGTENTTPLQIAGRGFLNRPSGVRGWGYTFTFSQPTNVWRAEIANAVGGGKGYLYADPTDANNPTTGKLVGTFSFADNGQVTNIVLTKPTQVKTLVAWIDGSDVNNIPRIVRLTNYAFY